MNTTNINEYNPKSGEILHIWDFKSYISYYNTVLELTYETEPPHGDFIYSMKIISGNFERKFNYWLYGRNLFFFNNYIFMEVLEARNSYKGQVKTGVLDIKNNLFTLINDWYCNFSIDEEKVILANNHTNKKLVIDDLSVFNWSIW